MRKIKFLPDTGNIITLEAAEELTVGQFIEALQEKGGQFDLSKNLLTEKKSKASFLTSDSVLPAGDISLFSTIKDPKGNAPTSRSDVYEAIKDLKAAYGDYVKTHFGNYTQVATDTLLQLLKTFSKSEARKSLSKGNAKTTKTVAKKAVTKTTASKEDLELRAAQKSFTPKIYRNR
jgi:hypothetical protein